MQTLYAVDFDIETSAVSEPTPHQAYHALVAHLAAWLAHSHTQAPSAEDLASAGQTDLSVETAAPGSPLPRKASWETTGYSENFALRLDLRQPLAGGNAHFVTRVTISITAGVPGSRLRVIMGREVTSGWISPVRVEWLRRPGLVRSVLLDKNLRATMLRQRVDGRYLKIYDDAAIPEIVSAVREQQRLPLLLTRPLTDAGWHFAAKASSELAGLVRVVCLASRATHERFNQEMPDVEVPAGGARLVWGRP